MVEGFGMGGRLGNTAAGPEVVVVLGCIGVAGWMGLYSGIGVWQVGVWTSLGCCGWGWRKVGDLVVAVVGSAPAIGCTKECPFVNLVVVVVDLVVWLWRKVV
jgi:hypothetical protein